MASSSFNNKKLTLGSHQSEDIPMAAIHPRHPEPDMAVPARAHLRMAATDPGSLRRQRQSLLAAVKTQTPYPSPYGSTNPGWLIAPIDQDLVPAGTVHASPRDPDLAVDRIFDNTVYLPYHPPWHQDGFEDVDIEAQQPMNVLQVTPAPRRPRWWSILDHLFTQEVQRRHLYGLLVMAMAVAIYLAILLFLIVREIKSHKHHSSAG
jgi:hypothetical protein